MDWVEFKDYLSAVTELSQDALHIYAAVLIQFGAAVVLRKSIAHPLPWLCILAITLLNEWADVRSTGKPVEEWQVIAGIQDLWNTMALPTLFMLLARFAPGLLTGRTTAASAANSRRYIFRSRESESDQD